MFTDSERVTFARLVPNCTPSCTPLCKSAAHAVFAIFILAFVALRVVPAAVDPQKEKNHPASSTRPPIHHAVLRAPSPILPRENDSYASFPSINDPVNGATRSAISPAIAPFSHRVHSSREL